MKRAAAIALVLLGLVCGSALAATDSAEQPTLTQTPDARLTIVEAGKGREGDACRHHDDCAPCWFCVKPTEGGEPQQGEEGKCQQRPSGWCCSHQIYPPIACGICDHRGTCMQNGQVVEVAKEAEAEGDETAGPRRALLQGTPEPIRVTVSGVAKTHLGAITPVCMVETPMWLVGENGNLQHFPSGTAITSSLPATASIVRIPWKKVIKVTPLVVTVTETVTTHNRANDGGQKASLRRALKGAEEEKAEEAAMRSAKVQRALALAQLPDCNCL